MKAKEGRAKKGYGGGGEGKGDGGGGRLTRA